MTTVRHLKALIDRERDETVVLLPGPDHSYRPARAVQALARLKDGEWSEDDGDEALENELGKRYRVIVVQ